MLETPQFFPPTFSYLDCVNSPLSLLTAGSEHKARINSCKSFAAFTGLWWTAELDNRKRTSWTYAWLGQSWSNGHARSIGCRFDLMTWEALDVRMCDVNCNSASESLVCAYWVRHALVNWGFQLLGSCVKDFNIQTRWSRNQFLYRRVWRGRGASPRLSATPSTKKKIIENEIWFQVKIFAPQPWSQWRQMCSNGTCNTFQLHAVMERDSWHGVKIVAYRSWRERRALVQPYMVPTSAQEIQNMTATIQ